VQRSSAALERLPTAQRRSNCSSTTTRIDDRRLRARLDDAVQAVLNAVDAISPPHPRLEAARELLHAMLLATGERAAEERRDGSPPDSTAQLEVLTDDGAQPPSG
jgi:hypothetical protein